MVKNKIYALLKYSTNNIGDEIQSIAARQFLPNIDYFIDRDKLLKYNGPEVKLILNGWFTHNPENWPPSDKIKPLFVSFHISNVAYSKFLSKKSIDYFKIHEPIGCRDFSTMNILRKKGIKAYFSGCLTLTLKKKGIKKNNKVLLVDVDKKIDKKVRARFGKEIETISHAHDGKLFSLRNHPLKNYLYRIEFLKKLGKSSFVGKFLRRILLKKEGEVIKFNRADRLLEKYEKAKLVITSRIHVALPCLAFGTPVIFIIKDQKDIRFNGLTNLFNSYDYSEFISPECNCLKRIRKNPNKYLKFRKELVNKCINFIKN